MGGNHEAANHLWELHYGGWVAPNIYYLGAAGVVNFGGVRIAGLSGIFNGRHFREVGFFGAGAVAGAVAGAAKCKRRPDTLDHGYPFVPSVRCPTI